MRWLPPARCQAVEAGVLTASPTASPRRSTPQNGILHDTFFSWSMRRDAAFTLVEIMIVVSVIALLAVMAVPSFLRARKRSQDAKFVIALRVASGAFEMYAAENNGYPSDVNRATVPSGMATYFGPTLDWTKPTLIGGNWDWDSKVFGFTAGISVVGSPADVIQMTEIDTMIDDGDLSTGQFRDEGGGRYSFILE
jgi:prepilin-type N-terminal cleavage/methylation domain-containing protein